MFGGHMHDANWTALAHFLRDARSREEMSQAGLAEAARLSLRTVQTLESGRPHPQPPRLLARMDAALHLPAGTTAAVLAGTAAETPPLRKEPAPPEATP